MQFTLNIAFCDASHYIPLAKCADECGWSSIAVADGLFYYESVSTPYPYSKTGERFWRGDTPFPDPFTIITAMAMVTKNIKFYSNVLKLPVRDPLLTAKQVSTAAYLSNNRVGLGIGLSPWPEDFELLNQQWSNRGPRSAEMVEIIRGVMTGDMFEFHGKYYDIPRLQIAPVSSEPVPIYIGGLAEPVLKRAARIADGYLGLGTPDLTFDDQRDLIKRIHQYREDYGRADQPFEIKMGPYDPDVNKIWALRDIGVTDVVLTPEIYYGASFRDLNARLDAVKRFADEVIHA